MISVLNKISKSNYVLIFTDLTRNVFSKKKFDKIILNSSSLIKRIIKKNYTVVIPTYNFKFPKKRITSDSPEFITSGYFAKHLINNFKVKRTNRPMYNYAVIGKNSRKIINLKQSTAWGEDSVISYLTKKKAIGIGINIDIENFGWVTIHSAEEKFKVPYRYYKTFSGLNLNNKKKVSEKMYVRNFKTKLTTNSNELYKKLKPKIKYYSQKTYKISLVNLNLAYEESCNLLAKNLYSLAKYEKN
tara:strand:- start:498 stop:1229 length:732 start_codon:yes stop_codon:yes gene_type:complete